MTPDWHFLCTSPHLPGQCPSPRAPNTCSPPTCLWGSIRAGHPLLLHNPHTQQSGEETIKKISGVAVGTGLRNIPRGNECNCTLMIPRDVKSPSGTSRKGGGVNQALGQSGSGRVNVFSPHLHLGNVNS